MSLAQRGRGNLAVGQFTLLDQITVSCFATIEIIWYFVAGSHKHWRYAGKDPTENAELYRMQARVRLFIESQAQSVCQPCPSEFLSLMTTVL
jgi:hypothetical protein